MQPAGIREEEVEEEVNVWLHVKKAIEMSGGAKYDQLSINRSSTTMDSWTTVLDPKNRWTFQYVPNTVRKNYTRVEELLRNLARLSRLDGKFQVTWSPEFVYIEYAPSSNTFDYTSSNSSDSSKRRRVDSRETSGTG